jgi:hypothetical protein
MPADRVTRKYDCSRIVHPGNRSSRWFRIMSCSSTNRHPDAPPWLAGGTATNRFIVGGIFTRAN